LKRPAFDLSVRARLAMIALGYLPLFAPRSDGSLHAAAGATLGRRRRC